jgi:transcriptional regulator with XRE-family HTH domain
MKIGDRIRALREAEGYSLAELGEKMGEAINRRKPDWSLRRFTGETVRLYEAGENNPGDDALTAIALVFGKTKPYVQFGVSGSIDRGRPAEYFSDEVLEVARAVDALDTQARANLIEYLRLLQAARKAVTSRTSSGE